MVENWHTSLSLQALVFFIEQTDETLVTELIALTPQERPRFLASTEYLMYLDRSSHMRFPLLKRVPRTHTTELRQILRLSDEQTDEVLVVELIALTPQERPRFLASTEYLIHLDLSSHMRFPSTKRDPLVHTRALGQTLIFCTEQFEEVLAARALAAAAASISA